MAPPAVYATASAHGLRNSYMFRTRYVNLYVLLVLVFVLSAPAAYAVPFGEIHRNIFPLSVARLTRSVLYGRDTTPTPSTAVIPTVPLKDVQELSYPNPAVDTVAALAPVENQQSQERQQDVQSQQSQLQLLISGDSAAIATLSVTPSPIPALDTPVTAQSDNGTTEESQRSIVVTTDYATGQQVTQPSLGNMQNTFTVSDATSVLSSVAADNSSPEKHSQQSGYLEQAYRSSQASIPSQNIEEQGVSTSRTNQNDSTSMPASTSEKSDSAQSSISSQYVAAAPRSRSSSGTQPMNNVDVSTISQQNYPTPEEQAKNVVSPSNMAGKEDVNESANTYGVTEVSSNKEVRTDEETGKQEVMTMPPLERRVYSTNLLPGCKKDSPSLLPPGFGGKDAVNKTILDVGAHIGDDYTIRGVTVGHTVIAFEPSPAVVDNFKKYMIQRGMPLSVVNLDHAVAAAAHARGRLARDAIDGMVVRVLIPRTSRQSGEGNSMGGDGIDMSQARVFLMPFALSNETGLTKFFESGCKMPHCGKVNRIPMQNVDSVTGNIVVPKYKLDDLILPADTRKIWFLKIDVEGHEMEVLQGARDLIRRSGLEYIVLEFSPNGQAGVQWGVDLLNELFEQGFTCFHMRGFGKCHDDTLRSPSLKCNFPFALNNASLAPTFEDYAKVFEIVEEGGKKKPHMADLMCKRRKMDY